MKAVLVGTDNEDALSATRQALGGDYRIDQADTRKACLDKLRRRRYEFIFMDVSFLKDQYPPKNRQDYAKAIRPFREYLPGSPLVVMAPQSQIREAVSAVKAGADNYLTYPIMDPQEVKYVVASLVDLQQMESELNHFRDRFWRDDLRQFVRTGSPLMREALEKVQSVAKTRDHGASDRRNRHR